MTLQIAIATASLILRWQTPSPGSWWLCSAPSVDAVAGLQVEAAGFEPTPCHVSFRLPNDGPQRFYWTIFVPYIPPLPAP